VIPKQEVMALAAELQLQAHVVEKDYALGWFLAGISAHPVIGPRWVFKGGTCLKKCYFETYRFSEDLDFTLQDAEHLDEGFLAEVFEEVCDWVYDACGLRPKRASSKSSPTLGAASPRKAASAIADHLAVRVIRRASSSTWLRTRCWS
jgi:predicted nucleotidyltransferase component of viral defense system